MCILCAIQSVQREATENIKQKKLPNTNNTYFISNSIDDSIKDQLIDKKCEDKLPPHLKSHSRVNCLPLKTTGDGNCLLHAISQSLWGIELYSILLRKALIDELTNNEDWYKEVKEKHEISDDDYKEVFSAAKASHAFLGFVHVLALANILKRTIIVYGDEKMVAYFGYGHNGAAGVFLPSRISHSEVHKAPPLRLVYYENHFIPLVAIEDNTKRNVFAMQYPKVVVKHFGFPKIIDADNWNKYLFNDNSVIAPTIVHKLRDIADEELKKKMTYTLYTGTDKLSQIEFSLEKDPWEEADKFIEENKLPKEDRNALASFLITQSDFEQLQPSVDLSTKFEENAIKLCKKQPTADIPCKAFVKMTKYPTDTSKIKLRIKSHNDCIDSSSESSSSNSVAPAKMHDAELKQLYSILDTITNNSVEIERKEDAKPLFNEQQFALLEKLLSTWKSAQVYPIIDIIRVLVLYKEVGNWYSNKPNVLFDNIFKHVNEKHVSTRTVLLWFITNFLAASEFQLQIEQQIPNLLKFLQSCLNQPEAPKLIKHVAVVLINLAVFLSRKPQLPSKARLNKLITIQFLTTQLSKQQTDQTVFLLKAVGTIIYNDEEIRTLLAPINPVKFFSTFITTTNSAQSTIAKAIVNLFNIPKE